MTAAGAAKKWAARYVLFDSTGKPETWTWSDLLVYGLILNQLQLALVWLLECLVPVSDASNRAGPMDLVSGSLPI